MVGGVGAPGLSPRLILPRGPVRTLFSMPKRPRADDDGGAAACEAVGGGDDEAEFRGTPVCRKATHCCYVVHGNSKSYVG